MYPSLPKYYRSSAQQQQHLQQHQLQQQQQSNQQYQQQHTTTPNNHHHHQHTFNVNGGHTTPQSSAIYAHALPMGSRSGKYMPQSQSQSTMQQQKAGYAGNVVQRHNSNVTELCRNYWLHNHHNSSSPASQIVYRSERHHSKRKSAVELLAETKQFFVKSDVAMAQRYNYAANNSSLMTSSKRGRNNSSPMMLTDGKYNPSYGESYYRPNIDFDGRRGVATTLQQQHQRRFAHIHHHHRHNHHSSMGCRTLNSRPTTYSNIGTSMSFQNKSHNVSTSEHSRENLIRLRSESYAGNMINFNETKAVSFEEGMTVRLPPPLYYSQQSFDNNAYESGEEPLVLTENYRPISPPAEYAEDPIQSNGQCSSSGIRYNYQRSYSHSHDTADSKAKRSDTAYNINGHKSLPDLHTQINRHSPHSEILSCCSRGNRSTKSTGESSLNRDSGGSSGHYTHRSEPCYRQYREIVMGSTNGVKKCCNSANATTRVEYRRDSGSSTQHSNTSYCEYICKTDIEKYDSSDYLFNFTTPEVPEAFQDDYVPPTPLSTPKYANEEALRFNYSTSSQPARIIRAGSGGDCSGGQRNSNTSYMKYKSTSDEPVVQSPGSTLSIEDISPPPIQFRRQKCIRFKNHNRISLPQPQSLPINSSNANSRLSQRRSEPPYYFFPKCFSAEEYSTQMNKDSPESTVTLCKPLRRSQEFRSSTEPPSPATATIHLEKFFDRLGLQDDKFREIYAFSQRRHSESGGGGVGGADGGGDGEDERINNDSDDSTVFFSDISTVDSMRLPDSTETQAQVTQAYRPTDPPSIVERNARIIKWLCNIRKAQGETM